jgi:gliding motility-associated-like protein
MKYLFSLLVLFSTCSIFAQLPSYVPTNGLVGYWPFNGNANDESGNGNNGTVNGATLTTDRFGVANKAYSFDGVNDFIQTNAIPVLGTISRTISFYIKIANPPSSIDYACLSYGGNSVNCNQAGKVFECGLFNNNNLTSARIDGTCAANYSNSGIDLNWHMLTFVFDNNIGSSFSFINIYIDGTLINTSSYNGSTIVNTSGLASLIFGNSNNVNRFYNGKLDDISIYNRALSQQEITNLYSSNQSVTNIAITPSSPSVCLGNSITLTASLNQFNSQSLSYPYTKFNGNEIWVSPTGSNITGNGSSANPYQTIQFAINNSSNGQYVTLKNGTYSGVGNINISTEGKQITVQSENGPLYSIVDCNQSGRGFFINSGETTNTVIKGIQIKNGKTVTAPLGYGSAIFVEDNSGIKIIQCIFQSNQDGCIQFGDNEVSGPQSMIENCAFIQNVKSCISASKKSFSVESCFFYANTSSGELFGNGHVANPAQYYQNCIFKCNNGNTIGGLGHGKQLINSLFIGNTSSLGVIYMGTNWSGTNTIDHCTFYNNSCNYYSTNWYDHTGQVSSSIFYPGDARNHVSGNQGQIPFSNSLGGNITGNGNIQGNPLFVNPSSNNFNLQTNSPCISTGVGNTNMGANVNLIQPWLFDFLNYYSQSFSSPTWGNGVQANSITITPTVSAYYNVTYSGCGTTLTDSIFVQVTNTPSINAGPNITTCKGSPITLIATGAANLSWSGGVQNGVSFIPTASQNYIVSGTDSNGCIGSDTTQLILINPTISTTDSTLCLGESTTLTSTAPSSSNASFCTSASLPSNLQTGLVGYWPFCGNANDVSGNGNNGTVNGASLTADRFGNANSAYSFDGVNDWINVANPSVLNFPTGVNFSVSFFYKPNNITTVPSGFNGLIARMRIDNNGPGDGWQIGRDNSNYRLEVGCNPNLNSVVNNNWVNITMIFNRTLGQIEYYQNGLLVSIYSCPNITSNFISNHDLKFGVERHGLQFTSGILDDIAIWNRTLSASEIQQLYTQGQTTYAWSPGNATTPSITVSPTATTTYTCTTTVNGVACTDAITVTVDSLNFSLPATTTVCGTSTTFSAPAGATSYLWNTNATTASIAPTTSGLYSCTVTKGACVKSDSTQLYLVNSTISTTDSTLCLGESTTLNVANASNSTNCLDLPGTLSNSLVGYWPFCGNTEDASGNNNDGIIQNGVSSSSDRFGNSNSSYNFNGQPLTYLDCGNSPIFDVTNGSLSISVWVKPDVASSGHKAIVAKQSSVTTNIYGTFQISLIDFVPRFTISNLNAQPTWYTHCIANSPINNSEWCHIVAIADTANLQLKLYINGQFSTSIAWGGTYHAGLQKLLIGSNFKSNFGSQYMYNFNGQIDDPAIWNRSLTTSEIQALYNHGLSTFAWSPGNATTPSITVSPTQTTTYTCTTTINGVACTDTITVTVDALNFTLPATTNVCGTSATLSAPAGATSYLWNTNATTASITPTSSGIYSCTATKGACVKSASTQLVLLNPIVSTSDSILCVGESTTLTSNTTVSPSSICSGAALPTNLQTGLVGYWPFCGNANDASGNGNNGTVNGATLTTDRFGNTNSAYSFDGNDWISATRAHQAVFTASVWVQSTNGNCNKPILDANNASWELYSDCANGQLNFKIWNGGTFTLYPTNIVLGTNTWFHVVAVYSSSQVKIYVNGSLITTQVTTAVPAISGVLNMGASLSGSSQYFTGKLDDIGIWSRALTLAEIQQLYTQGETTYSWSPGNATTQSITVSPTTTTTYTCTTTVNGASCSDAIVVTVNQLPSVNAGTDQSVCLNQPVTLSGSGATSYSWNNSVINNTPFTPTSTATYTVTGTDANGCVNTDNVLVTIKPLPATNAGLDQSICIGNQAIFNATGAFSYSWSNGVANNVPFFPTTTANYIVTGTNTNGCTKTDTMTITVNALPIVNAGSDTSVCFGQNATLTATGAVSYSWVPGNATTASISVSPTVTTSYIVTGTNANACQGKDTVLVTIKPLPSINAGTDKTICAGDSVALTASGSPLIAWNNGILNGVYFYPTSTTTYTVTGTGANGCTNTDQAVVFVNALPNVNAGADTAVCNGSFLTLSGSGAVSYTWSNSVTNNVPFIPSLSNTFTVVGTDANGCKDSDQIQVTVNILPPVNAGNNVAICIGDSIQLNGSGAVSYVWDNGVINNTAFYPTTTLTYHVIGTNANGCSNSDSVIVTVNPLPTVFAGNDTLLCDQSTYTLSGSGATTYTWNNGVTNGVPFTVTANTTYTVQGIDGNGCQNTDQVTLTTKPLPTVDAGSDKAVCYGDSLFFTATGSGVAYSWSNGLINGNYFTPTTTMTLTVTATAANGCTQTDQVLATVNPLPTVDAGPDRIICKGQAIALNAVSNGSIVWGGGVVNNLPFNPSTTATYGVTATSAAGCVNTDDVTVSVGDYPNANFYTLTPTQYSPNSTFDFVNLSTGAATYDWDFGDLIGTSTAENPSYTYQPLVTATYFVTLVVSSTLGCKDSLTSIVQLINNSPGVDVIIPTGFSPNNDSDNDDWTIYGIENYPNSKISVFNRWGLKVFEGSELFPTWNGIYGGVMLPTADYYYIVELSDGRKFNGVVTLKQ